MTRQILSLITAEPTSKSSCSVEPITMDSLHITLSLLAFVGAFLRDLNKFVML